jgi:Flp pilus assembly pilin Flp
MKQLLKEFATDDSGLETVEYAIIAGLIVTATVTIIAAIGTWVANQYTTVKTNLGA